MEKPSVPISPNSSKRSRSRDSGPSTADSSLNTPTKSTPVATPSGTPSVSTNSLVIPSSTPSTPANGDPHDPIPYPAFLKPSREVHAKWARLDWTQMERMRDSAQASGTGQPDKWARCTGDEYMLRNRYANVDPYQSNRVRLEVPEGQWDYINASPIELQTTKSGTLLKYIATQGPKVESWSHIWRMIWKENASPAVIVMLTQTYEANREKCYPYYPQSPENPDMRINEQDEFEDGLIHNLHLESLSTDEEARTQVREIDMTTDDGTESKKIFHLLFAGWPDFSVPEGADRAAMLKLVEISRSKNADNATNPRIVHCSAGIGRSGTFIALDWLMQELDEGTLDDPPESSDPVMHIVEKLRDQRPGMVQSKVQFQFIYDVLRDRWRERWINLHPDEAAELHLSPGGLARAATPSDVGEPALKRQKSMHGTVYGEHISLPTRSQPPSRRASPSPAPDVEIDEDEESEEEGTESTSDEDTNIEDADADDTPDKDKDKDKS